MTINEPQVFINHGHQVGTHAPGLMLPFPDVLRASHNTLLAHGKCVQAIRANSKTKCRVGLAPVGIACIPATDSPEDITAAKKAMFSIGSMNIWNSSSVNKDARANAVVAKDIWNNTWWMDPMFLGKYPEDGLKFYGSDVPVIHDKDMATIHQPLDFFGANIYRGETIRAGKDGQPELVNDPVGHPLTAYHWGVAPAALYWGPKNFYERYKLPIYMTENGMLWKQTEDMVRDVLVSSGINFVEVANEAAFYGPKIDVQVWSAIGREFTIATNQVDFAVPKRFGLVYTDYPTQKRILKDSALWYKEVIKSNGANL